MKAKPRTAARAVALVVGLASVFASAEASAEPLVLGKIRAWRPRHRVHHRHHGHASGAPSEAASNVPPEDRWDFSMKLDGGYEVGRLDGDASGGARWGVGFGMQNDAVGAWGTLRGRIVPASVGVQAWDVRIGVDADVFRSGPVHLGAAVELGALEQERLAGTHPNLALLVGVAARGGFDLVQFGSRDRSALTLDLRADASLLAGGGSYLTLGALAGLRF